MEVVLLLDEFDWLCPQPPGCILLARQADEKDIRSYYRLATLLQVFFRGRGSQGPED